MNTTTTLTGLLTERLSLWDAVDQAYDDGLVTRAIEITQYINDVITPSIREAYKI